VVEQALLCVRAAQKAVVGHLVDEFGIAAFVHLFVIQPLLDGVGGKVEVDFIVAGSVGFDQVHESNKLLKTE
jgi:hypothetical protein